MENGDRQAKHFGLIRISFRELEQLLKLSPDYRILKLREASWDRQPDEFYIMVEGPQMPLVEEGHVVPVVNIVQHKRKKYAEIIPFGA